MAKQAPLIGLITRKVHEENDRMLLSGLCVLKLLGSRKRIKPQEIELSLAMKPAAVDLTLGPKAIKLPKGYTLCRYTISVDIQAMEELDIQNKLIVNYGELEGRVLYDISDLKSGKNRTEKIIRRDDMVMYFRQSKFNSLGVTVRDINQYDLPEGEERIKRAHKRAEALKNENIILMYEKNCARYEESASVLFEKLIDAGYENIYYVVNFDNPAIQGLDDKYKRKLIDKDSDKHLEYFFAANTFIATESTEHALQLRAHSKLVMDKVKSKDLKYVFLQHGVMYMVSLNSELRTGFRNAGFALQRTVVSSELEAQHFIELADMKREDLYITGLAKFDRCSRYDDADRIVIMPTWRRWELNQAKHELEATAYYQMVERMYKAVPEQYRDKTIILPHPLMAERFANAEGLGKAVVLANNYDEILKSCSLLITDYSSIAYDAFYRGANVAFCWEEKDECMEHYGEGSFLMLNEDNVYGRVCMNEQELNAAVSELYMKPQSEENKARYRKIVEFNDGRNSERIIEHLIEDGVIEAR